MPPSRGSRLPPDVLTLASRCGMDGRHSSKNDAHGRWVVMVSSCPPRRGSDDAGAGVGAVTSSPAGCRRRREPAAYTRRSRQGARAEAARCRAERATRSATGRSVPRRSVQAARKPAPRPRRADGRQETRHRIGASTGGVEACAKSVRSGRMAMCTERGHMRGDLQVHRATVDVNAAST